jgi:ABC-2 type transport system ATP-binding protein
MCTHIGIIERGHLLASGRVSDILRNLHQDRRIVTVKVQAPAEHFEAIGAIIAQGPGVKEMRPLLSGLGSSDENSNLSLASWEIELHGHETELNNLLRYLVWQNIPVYNFAEREDDLEDIFLKVTQGIVN